jgi:protein phosphatase
MTKFSMRTDPGLRYEGNEDSMGFDLELGVWLVADGMGGHAAGEVASQLAVTSFLEHMRTSGNVEAAALHAHQTIQAKAQTQAAQLGMGTTLVAVQISQVQLQIVWVGDSRAYLWRHAELTPLTTDHSYVQMLIESGDLTEATAREHPQRNMVTQVLGVGEPQPQTRRLALADGDWVLLCSDGLHDELTDAQIAEALIEAQADIDKAADLLIERALAHGGRDNVSLMIVAPTVSGSGALQGGAAASVQTEAAVAQKKFPLLSTLAMAIGVLLMIFFLWGAV